MINGWGLLNARQRQQNKREERSGHKLMCFMKVCAVEALKP